MQQIVRHLTRGALVAAGLLAGCATNPVQSPDVIAEVRKSIADAGLKNVTAKQDRAKGVVTLGGHVANEGEKAQAEALVKPLAVGQVVALEIAVIPAGVEKDAKAINADIDQGIESNLSAALTASKLRDAVKTEVKNAVVTLHGEVSSQEARATAERVAAEVPYVKQVVNTLQVHGQKATSTK